MAKKDTVTLINTAVCVIFVDDKMLKPGDQIVVDQSSIERFESLIARGELTIDNFKENQEVVKRVSAKRKKDPTEGKSRAELEDGGEF